LRQKAFQSEASPPLQRALRDFLVIAIAVMLWLEWRLALAVLAFAPVPALIAAYAGPEQMQRERTLLDRWAQIYSRFNEILSGIVIVRRPAAVQRQHQGQYRLRQAGGDDRGD
jgi:ABC-type bacteriocin/lantibiotic exporter with double-glycine peptidase domain